MGKIGKKKVDSDEGVLGSYLISSWTAGGIGGKELLDGSKKGKMTQKNIGIITLLKN